MAKTLRVCQHSRLRAISLLPLFIIVAPTQSYAWGNRHGHRHIIDEAVAIIDAKHPGEFGEVSQFAKTIADGAEIEDTNLRDDSHFGDAQPKIGDASVIRHFHDPFGFSEERGLHVHYYYLDPNSLHEFGPRESAVTRSMSLFQQTAPLYNEQLFIRKPEAYKLLGRIAHLVAADLYQPQHTHNDAHLPESFGHSLLEDTFDTTMLSRFDDLDFSSSYAEPPRLTVVGVAEIGTSASVAAFNISKFDGFLPSEPGKRGQIQILGTLAQPQLVQGNPESTDPNLRGDHFTVQSGGFGFVYDGEVRGDVVWYLDATSLSQNAPRRRQDWWELPEDEESATSNTFYFDPNIPLQVTFIDRHNNSVTYQIANYFIDRMIPQAYVTPYNGASSPGTSMVWARLLVTISDSAIHCQIPTYPAAWPFCNLASRSTIAVL